MKVFISWSGTLSHEIALIFKKWLRTVIQEIDSYVSSEDIDKGARWSQDIAKELEGSSYGVLCVTRENLNAPWLNFEAGALSKSMDKSRVCPFLFDLKRSDVGGPILQFQSAIFEKGDIHKLVVSLYNHAEHSDLTAQELDEAFDRCWPDLKEKLESLKQNRQENEAADTSATAPDPQAILEELLDLTRTNQKLLQSSGTEFAANTKNFLKDFQSMQDQFHLKTANMGRKLQRFHPVVLDELVNAAFDTVNGATGIQMALSLIREPCPWIYDAGIEALSVIRSGAVPPPEKKEAVHSLLRVIHYSFEQPEIRGLLEQYEGWPAFSREFGRVIETAFNRLLEKTA